MIPTWVRDPKNDNLFINDLRKHVKGGVLVPPANANPLVVAAAPAAGIPTLGMPVVYEGPQDGCREIYSMVGAFDAATLADPQARFSVQIDDQAYRRRYMNRDILVNHIFGTPGNPLFLPQPIWLENQQVLIFQFLNNSIVGAATFRQLMEGRTFQAQSLSRSEVTQLIGKKRREAVFFNPFWLTSDNPIIIPAGGQTTAFFSNARDYYLLLRYIIRSWISTGIAGDVNEAFTVRFFDATNNRPLMNQPMTANMMGGNSNFPYVLPQPWSIEPVTSIRADFQNLITDQPTEVFLTFCGVGCFVANQNPWEGTRVDQPAVTTPAYGAP